MGPIDYGSLQAKLDFSPLMQGLQLRQAKQNIQADSERQDKTVQLAREQFTVNQQEHAAYLADVEAYKADPTPGNLRNLGLNHPDLSDQIYRAGNSYTTAAKQDLVGSGFSAIGALAAGNPDLAASGLEKRITGLKNSGVDTSHTQAAVDMIKAGKTKEATAYLSYAMAGLVGTDHAAGIMETLGVGGKADDKRADNERQDRALNLNERRADATIARGEAASARAERAADRADRKAAGGGGGGSGNYEYRIGPDGKLQRRKR
ncbi:hypothetical protein U1707_08620 [Sphingomonas sp. PB2P12]|uniref:hypothetical protein n=1 Tax=Sphingomonas sandaracina TaxID=3096157 RepID=UPI002FCB7B5D